MTKLKSRLIIGLAVLTLTTSVFADTKTDYDQAIQYAKQILEENYDFSCNTDEKMTEVEYDGIIGHLDKEGNPIGEWKSKDKTDKQIAHQITKKIFIRYTIPHIDQKLKEQNLLFMAMKLKINITCCLKKN